MVMGLRIQKERQGAVFCLPLTNMQDTSALMKKYKLAKKDVLIIHPGPVNRGESLDHSG